MKVIKLLLVVLFCALITGVTEANTLFDRPPTIFYPEGHYLEGWPRKPFRDMFGYSYQRHQFVGYFANVYLGGDGLPPYRGNSDIYLQATVDRGYFDTEADAEAFFDDQWYWELRDVALYMFWNDAWLSNQDRADSSGGGEPDGALDRHYGYPNYFDSGAELIQYQIEPILILCKGRLKTVFLYYYSRIVAVSSDAELVDGIWYTAEGEEMGPEVYGSFARVEEFLYDPLALENPCRTICLQKRKWCRELCEKVMPEPKAPGWRRNWWPDRSGRKGHDDHSNRGKSHATKRR